LLQKNNKKIIKNKIRKILLHYKKIIVIIFNIEENKDDYTKEEYGRC